MLRVVGLVGGECTGKSTLADALSDTLPASKVPEVLRAFTAQHGRSPRQEEQVEILMQQQIAEADMRAETPLEWVVCDPATLMIAIYSSIYFNDDSLTAAAITHAEVAYDAIIWCDRDLPWVPDPGQRDGSEWRDRAHDALAAVLPRISIPIHRASGPLDARIESTVTFLRGLDDD